MSKVAGKIINWSVGSVVGNAAWTAAVSIALFMANKETGCISVVLERMSGHEMELAGWTASFALAGAMVGAAIRHRFAIKEMDEKDDKIRELEERPTAEDLDDAVQSETDRMMERVDELTCKLSDAYREIDYLKSDGKVMTREQLASYISNLPDALKRRLRYIESHGGSVRETKDGELSTLEQQGIITSQLDDWVESRYVWSIVPDARSVIKSNRAILNS